MNSGNIGDNGSAPGSEIQLPGLSEDERKKAAELIQKTYRGHRARREINGYGLDPSTRWIETIRDAKYQKTTTPRAPDDSLDNNATPVKDKWHRVTEIARHAGADDSTPSVSDVSESEAWSSDPERKQERTTAEQEERRERKAIAKEKRKKTAKMMDLQYFLEMVDQKHRYGSNLRKYHAYWKTQDTDQNFFYWLDQGDGREVEVEECSRERLDREQVRYLTRAERLKYLVHFDSQGLLRWAKNDELVWTKDELYRDSVNGIVPISDSAPKWSYNIKTEYHDESSSASSSSSSDDDDDDDEEEEEEDEDQKGKLEGERYVNESFHRAKGPEKLKHVSAAVLFNHMVRQSLKKGHKWIFVADTSFRLYIGYKQSGAFQHSSFLHGARILSAGLIKVKHGQLRRLSPLSGHYRPPTANFRAFVHNLEDVGADMSRVSISRSYGVLVGLEGYVKTRRRVKRGKKSMTHHVDKVLKPEKVKEEQEAAQDHSQSAQKEREYLEKQQLAEREKRNSSKDSGRGLKKRFSNAWGRMTGKTAAIENQGVSHERGVPGTGPEDGVPAPDGHRRPE